MKVLNLTILFIFLLFIQKGYCESKSSNYKFIELKGKKAVEQFLDYKFQKENDPIINQLQKQFLQEGSPTEFSDVVNDPEFQKQYLEGYGLTNNKEKYAFLDFQQPNWETTYSVYHKGAKTWYLIGEIFSRNKYGGSSLRFENNPGMVLISASNGGGGTGGLDNRWTVYTIWENHVLQVLEYPSEGYRYGWGLSYDVEYKSGNIKWHSSKTKLDSYLDLTVKYFQGSELSEKHDERKLLFEKNQRYFLSWNELKGGFLWELEGGITANPFSDIFLFNSDEEFMSKYKAEIETVGLKTDPSSVSWYSTFIKSLKRSRASKSTK